MAKQHEVRMPEVWNNHAGWDSFLVSQWRRFIFPCKAEKVITKVFSGVKDHVTVRPASDIIPHIVLKEVRQFAVSHPTIERQRRIVTHLDKFKAKVGELNCHPIEGVKELDALLPAIPEKAFKGEL